VDFQTQQAIANLVHQLTDLQDKVTRVERAAGTPQLPNASITGGGITAIDESGTHRGTIGFQNDGTFATTAANGPPPPAPSAPAVAPGPLSLTVTWDGLFAEGDDGDPETRPADFDHVQVHLSVSSGYTPDASTLHGTLQKSGALVCTPLVAGTTYYAVLVGVNTSGITGPASTATTGVPEEVVATDVLDGIITTVKLADDAVTQAKVATAAIGTTQIADDAVTTPKVVAGAIQTAQLAAEAVNAGKLAAGAVTTSKLDALAVTADKIAANAITTGKLAAGAIDAMTINGATINGTVVNGSTINGTSIIGSSMTVKSTDGGVFVYDGEPTLGNLIVSIASAAGTDDFGNSYPKGVDVNQGTIAGSLISIEPGPDNGIFVYGTVPTVTTFTSGSGNWTAPAGVTSVKVECWGGGGEYAAEATFAVTPGNSYAYAVGAGGTAVSGGANGHAGAATTFGGAITAHGGTGGNPGDVGVGGSGSTNTTHFNGGIGGLSVIAFGAGGAGSGGFISAGNNATDNSQAGAVAVAGGGGGGTGGTSSKAGTVGGSPGGGGGGAGSQGTSGAGGGGRVAITYTPARTLLASIAGAPGTDPYGNAYPVGISGVIGAGLFAAKSADESVTASTTLQNDDHLVVPVAANATYTIDGHLQWIGNDTGDIKFAFAFPSGSTLHWGMIGPNDTEPAFASLGTRGTGEWFARVSQTTSSAFIQYSASTAALLGRMSGLLVTGGSAGNLTLQWAQFVSNPTATTLKQGSWLRLSRVA
jgi:hypothetical protein